jgi:hypothetical protein
MENHSHLGEIRDLLTAEPSPEFRVRLRQRVEDEAVKRRGIHGWGVAGSLSLVAGVALMVAP